MPLFEYVCDHCNRKWEEFHKVEHRDTPLAFPCPRCQEYSVRRLITPVFFHVSEGACGNAATGYSSTVGDAENWKARDKGEPEPY